MRRRITFIKNNVAAALDLPGPVEPGVDLRGAELDAAEDDRVRHALRECALDRPNAAGEVQREASLVQPALGLRFDHVIAPERR